MSKRAKVWAKKARHNLLTTLGMKCIECGETDELLLTFDHKHTKGWSARGLSTDQRMVRYRREAKENKLQILCVVCNSRKGVPDDQPLLSDEQERFDIENEGYWSPQVLTSELTPF